MTRPALREKHDGAPGDQLSIRLWLRLLSCTMVIEKRLQRQLTEQFSTTLPRFDVLAALDRNPGGMMMSELSRALLVSNGNVTALIKTLARDGLVTIASSPTDRRASIVNMTDAGRASFIQLAAAHHGWLAGMLDSVSRKEQVALLDLLGTLKASIASDRSGDAA